MTAQSRDTQILEKIQGYCNDIMFTHTEYAHDYDHSFPLRFKAPKGMKHNASDAASRNLLEYA